MSPPYIATKPENALKRAQELITVSQESAAIDSLVDLIMSKRARSMPILSLEAIMMKLVELCVDNQRSKTLKDAIHQFKNISQNTGVTPLENVVGRLFDLAEERLNSAQAEADLKVTGMIDDLEAIETPETVMMALVSGEQSKDRTVRAVVAPWLKFLWESFRNVLDNVRNNVRTEELYQDVAKRAFEFCLKHQRKTEFRRLCDLLRNHLATAVKYANQPHSINLDDPETLRRFLDTRIRQLDVAIDMEIWQEAFKSVEDVHNLIAMAKAPPKAGILMQFYRQLAKTFFVADNYLYHAAAQLTFYQLWRSQTKVIAAEDHQRIADVVAIAALSVPTVIPARSKIAFLDADDGKQRSAKLSALIGITDGNHPTRSSILANVVSQGVLEHVSPHVKQLYNLLEMTFSPLSLCSEASKYIAALDDTVQSYIPSLKEVVLAKLIFDLSQVYSCISLSRLYDMASSIVPNAIRVEMFIMNGCRRGNFSLRVDHGADLLTFVTSNLFAVPNPTATTGQVDAGSVFRSQLAQLYSALDESMRVVGRFLEVKDHAEDPKVVEAKSEKYRMRNLERKVIIEKRRELSELIILQKEREEARERQMRMQQELEAEKIRLAEESRARELARMQQEREAIQKQEAKEIAEALKKQGHIDATDLAALDKDKLIEMQVKQLEKTKNEMQTRVRQVMKRMDYLERAYRREEIPLVEKDYAEQQKLDEETYKKDLELSKELAKQHHDRDSAIKKRIMFMKSEIKAFSDNIMKERRSIYDETVATIKSEIDAKIQSRLDTYRKIKEERDRKAREEEDARRQKEEEERKQREAEEAERLRLEEEKEKKRQELAERQRKLDEQAALQRQREEEAEQRRLQRAKEKEASAAGARQGKYVPPSQRAVGGDAPVRKYEARSGPPTPRTETPEPRVIGKEPAVAAATPPLKPTVGAWKPRFREQAPSSGSSSPSGMQRTLSQRSSGLGGGESMSRTPSQRGAGAASQSSVGDDEDGFQTVSKRKK